MVRVMVMGPLAVWTTTDFLGVNDVQRGAHGDGGGLSKSQT
jgi:hypothetical protein